MYVAVFASDAITLNKNPILILYINVLQYKYMHMDILNEAESVLLCLLSDKCDKNYAPANSNPALHIYCHTYSSKHTQHASI